MKKPETIIIALIGFLTPILFTLGVWLIKMYVHLNALKNGMDKATRMITFIQGEIVESAKELSSLIQKSMPLQIEESKSEEA